MIILSGTEQHGLGIAFVFLGFGSYLLAIHKNRSFHILKTAVLDSLENRSHLSEVRPAFYCSGEASVFFQMMPSDISTASSTILIATIVPTMVHCFLPADHTPDMPPRRRGCRSSRTPAGRPTRDTPR